MAAEATATTNLSQLSTLVGNANKVVEQYIEILQTDSIIFFNRSKLSCRKYKILLILTSFRITFVDLISLFIDVAVDRVGGVWVCICMVVVHNPNSERQNGVDLFGCST